MRYTWSMKKNEMKTSNAEEMVSISRAEYEELKLQNQWLLEQLGLAKKQKYGSSSEQMKEELEEQLLYKMERWEYLTDLAKKIKNQ